MDYIIPVPLHKKKLRKRGYNQLSVFGKNFGNCISVPYREDILIKVLHTDSQTKKILPTGVKTYRKRLMSYTAKNMPESIFSSSTDVMTTRAPP